METSESASQQPACGVSKISSSCGGVCFCWEGKPSQSSLRRKNNRRMALWQHVQAPERKVTEFGTAPVNRDLCWKQSGNSALLPWWQHSLLNYVSGDLDSSFGFTTRLQHFVLSWEGHFMTLWLAFFMCKMDILVFTAFKRTATVRFKS